MGGIYSAESERYTRRKREREYGDAKEGKRQIKDTLLPEIREPCISPIENIIDKPVRNFARFPRRPIEAPMAARKYSHPIENAIVNSHRELDPFFQNEFDRVDT